MPHKPADDEPTPPISKDSPEAGTVVVPTSHMELSDGKVDEKDIDKAPKAYPRR